MTSQKGSRFKNFEILTSSSVFSLRKIYPYQFLDQNYYFIAFYWVFGEFWAILGKISGQWHHKRDQDLKTSKFRHHHRFSRPKKSYPYQFLDQNTHFIMFYWVLGEFGAILGKIGGQWRHKRGRDLKVSKFWHHHRFSLPQKHTHTNF